MLISEFQRWGCSLACLYIWLRNVCKIRSGRKQRQCKSMKGIHMGRIWSNLQGISLQFKRCFYFFFYNTRSVWATLPQ